MNRGTGTALDGARGTTVGATTVLWTPNASTDNVWTVAVAWLRAVPDKEGYP